MQKKLVMGEGWQASSQKNIASRQWTPRQTDLAAGSQEQEEGGDVAERAGLASEWSCWQTRERQSFSRPGPSILRMLCMCTDAVLSPCSGLDMRHQVLHAATRHHVLHASRLDAVTCVCAFACAFACRVRVPVRVCVCARVFTMAAWPSRQSARRSRKNCLKFDKKLRQPRHKS